MTKALAPIGRGRYAFLLFDSTFKVVICNPENENLLIQILELLIPGKKISQIIFSDKEKHGLVISEKRVNFDLLCKDAKTGEEFLVEVQNAPQNSFRDRALSYSTYPIREQLAVKLKKIRNVVKAQKEYIEELQALLEKNDIIYWPKEPADEKDIVEVENAIDIINAVRVPQDLEQIPKINTEEI